MDNRGSNTTKSANQSSFLKKGDSGAAAAILAARMLPGSLAALNQGEDDGPPITKDDIAILTFLSALEQVEADLWKRYVELGGRRPLWPAQGLSAIDL